MSQVKYYGVFVATCLGLSLGLQSLLSPGRGVIDGMINDLESKDGSSVILGNSAVMHALDLRAFEHLTGESFHMMARAGRNSAYWYLLIKNVVTKAKNKPKRVILTFYSHTLTTADKKVNGRYRKDLALLSDGYDPVLARFAFHGAGKHSVAEGLRRHIPLFRNREVTKSRLDERVAGVMRRLFNVSREEHKRANAEAFKAAKMIKENYQQAVLDDNDDILAHYDFDKQLEKSFLPEMLRLLDEAGIEAIFINLPVNKPLDGVRKAYFRKLCEYLRRSNSTYIDLSQIADLRNEHYMDYVHLNAEGQKAFTPILAARWRAAVSTRGTQWVFNKSAPVLKMNF